MLEKVRSIITVLPAEVVEIYAQVAVVIGRLGETSPRTFILRYKKRIVIRTMLFHTSQGSFTPT